MERDGKEGEAWQNRGRRGNRDRINKGMKEDCSKSMGSEKQIL